MKKKFIHVDDIDDVKVPQRTTIQNGKRVYFANPLSEPNTMIKNPGKYDRLDDNGFISEGEYVTPDDTIIGKCYKSKDNDGKEITNCFGSVPIILSKSKLSKTGPSPFLNSIC